MTRQTSRDAYYKIRDSGLLSKSRWEVYDLLFKHGPKTAAELWQYSPQRHNLAYRPANINRLCELRNYGVVREVETRKCSVTGHTVIVWDVTGNLPVKPPRKSKKVERSAIDAAVLEERLACATLAREQGSRRIANLITERSNGKLFS